MLGLLVALDLPGHDLAQGEVVITLLFLGAAVTTGDDHGDVPSRRRLDGRDHWFAFRHCSALLFSRLSPVVVRVRRRLLWWFETHALIAGALGARFEPVLDAVAAVEAVAGGLGVPDERPGAFSPPPPTAPPPFPPPPRRRRPPSPV